MTDTSDVASPGAGTAGSEGLGILHIVRNLDTGGAQEVVRTLVEHLAGAGHRPVVCSLADGPLAADIRQAGIPVEIISRRQLKVLSPLRFVAESKRIRSDFEDIVRRHRVDVIQTHLLRSVDFVAASVTTQDGGLVPTYWTFHNEAFTLRAEHLSSHRWLLRPKRMAYRLRYRLASRRVAGLIAVSADVREALLRDVGRVDHLITVIRNGVDTRRYGRSAQHREDVRRELGLDSEAKLMTMVATFKRQKGHEYLIKAAARLLPENPDTHVVLVGDGGLRASTAADAGAFGIADRVHFLGDRRDVPRLLAASDIFVLPSLWEGLPMSLLEAMATGLPCVASAVSGVTEVIEDGSGLVTTAGDVTALEGALRHLLENPQEAERMGRRARDRVEGAFSAVEQARRHASLYRRGIDAHDRS
jgi:glycosyltransferase involved in cell wall biosynthesis